MINKKNLKIILGGSSKPNNSQLIRKKSIAFHLTQLNSYEFYFQSSSLRTQILT